MFDNILKKTKNVQIILQLIIHKKSYFQLLKIKNVIQTIIQIKLFNTI